MGRHCDYPDRREGAKPHGTQEMQEEFYRTYPVDLRKQYEEYAKNPLIGTSRQLWYDFDDEDDEETPAKETA